MALLMNLTQHLKEKMNCPQGFPENRRGSHFILWGLHSSTPISGRITKKVGKSILVMNIDTKSKFNTSWQVGNARFNMWKSVMAINILADCGGPGESP